MRLVEKVDGVCTVRDADGIEIARFNLNSKLGLALEAVVNKAYRYTLAGEVS